MYITYMYSLCFFGLQVLNSTSQVITCVGISCSNWISFLVCFSGFREKNFLERLRRRCVMPPPDTLRKTTLGSPHQAQSGRAQHVTCLGSVTSETPNRKTDTDWIQPPSCKPPKRPSISLLSWLSGKWCPWTVSVLSVEDRRSARPQFIGSKAPDAKQPWLLFFLLNFTFWKFRLNSEFLEIIHEFGTVLHVSRLVSKNYGQATWVWSLKRVNMYESWYHPWLIMPASVDCGHR